MECTIFIFQISDVFAIVANVYHVSIGINHSASARIDNMLVAIAHVKGDMYGFTEVAWAYCVNVFLALGKTKNK